MTIKREFTQRGIPVRPVFLMRDPIERVISSQRMKLRKRGQKTHRKRLKPFGLLLTNCQNESRFAVITRRLWAP